MNRADRNPGPSGQAGHQSEPVLHGREAELDRIRELLSKAAASRGATLVVQGEPGMGKTALLDTAEREARGMRVLRTCGVDLEAPIPFAGLFDLFRGAGMRKVIDRLPPVQRTALRKALGLEDVAESTGGLYSGAGQDRFAICTGTLALLSEAAEEQPLLLIVDDAQWLDEESFDSLLFAARRLRMDAVAMLCALRGTGPRSAAPGDFECIRLQPLDEHSTNLLITDRLGRQAAQSALTYLVGATGGNPLTLLEALRTLTEPQLRGEEMIPQSLPGGVSAAELFTDRINRLDLEALLTLLLVCLDSTGQAALVRQAALSLGAHYAAAIQQLEAEGLVRVEFATPSIAHPLVRAAVFEKAEPAQVRTAHRALAEALVGRTDPTARAWHLAAAATEPDETAAAALDAAAMIAQSRSAYGRAAVTLERAAALSSDDRRRVERLIRAAVDARHAGRSDDAARLLGLAAQGSQQPALQAMVDAEQARADLDRGHTRTAGELLERAAARLQDDDPHSAAVLLGQAAFAAVFSGEEVKATNLALSARELAGQSKGDPEPIVELTLGLALLSEGDALRSLTVLRKGAELAERKRAETEPDYLAFAGLALTWVGEFEQAREMLERLLSSARAEAATGLLGPLLYAAAYLEARTGHLIAAYAVASEGVEIATVTCNNLWRYLSLTVLCFTEAAQGREADCRAHAQQAADLMNHTQIRFSAALQDALGLLELGLGRPEKAIVHLEEANLRSGSHQPVYSRPSAPDLAEAYLRAGRPLPATFVTALETISAQRSHPSAAALAWRCLGLAADDSAIDHCFTTALQLHSLAENPLAYARTELCYGERLRRAGRRVDARSHLAQAHTLLLKLGAHGWAERANAELRAAGGQGTELGEEGLHRLTPQELKVAFTIAQGLSNRQAGAALYLSPKTIEFHLDKIYRKLGIRSRLELAAAIARHQQKATNTTGSDPREGPGHVG